jgi:hypothetical protein
MKQKEFLVLNEEEKKIIVNYLASVNGISETSASELINSYDNSMLQVMRTVVLIEKRYE